MVVEMKGENGNSAPTLLFFSYLFVGRYAFVERLFGMYFAIYQNVIRSLQQFSVLVIACKSARIRYGKLHKHHLLF